MSSSWMELKAPEERPATALVYLDMSSRALLAELGSQRPEVAAEREAERRRVENELSDEMFARRIETERLAAVREVEERLRGQFEQTLEAERAQIAKAIRDFDVQREDYFGRAEAEIVQLALTIAAKILHREAQVDPMLVATLVRMAVEKMREGSSVKLRVGTGAIERWKGYFAGQMMGASVQCVEDATLSDQDCFLETELGSTNFGLDTQLKEVEQGFFDLMALRPVKG